VPGEGSGGGCGDHAAGGERWRRAGGARMSRSLPGWRWRCQPPSWTARWWTRHSSTRLSRLVAPPQASGSGGGRRSTAPAGHSRRRRSRRRGPPGRVAARAGQGGWHGQGPAAGWGRQAMPAAVLLHCAAGRRWTARRRRVRRRRRRGRRPRRAAAARPRRAGRPAVAAPGPGRPGPRRRARQGRRQPAPRPRRPALPARRAAPPAPRAAPPAPRPAPPALRAAPSGRRPPHPGWRRNRLAYWCSSSWRNATPPDQHRPDPPRDLWTTSSRPQWPAATPTSPRTGQRDGPTAPVPWRWEDPGRPQPAPALPNSVASGAGARSSVRDGGCG
jgi:hypothetical protein